MNRFVINEGNFFIRKHENPKQTLFSYLNEITNDEQREEIRQQIITQSTLFMWLETKGFELVFCMFGCDPYLRKKYESDEHFETNCNGNSSLKMTEQSRSNQE